MQAFCFFYYLNIITMNNETETTFKYSIFLDSSMVEHTAVNRGVVGSSPTRGVFLRPKSNLINRFVVINSSFIIVCDKIKKYRT